MTHRNFTPAANAMQILNAIPYATEPTLVPVQAKDGRIIWQWIGPGVPAELQWKRRDGQPIPDKELRGIKKFGALAVHQQVFFESQKEAIEAAKAYSFS